jgi:hypothetical protein
MIGTHQASPSVIERTEAGPEDKRFATGEAFAKEFTHFEWRYLCSYRSFLKSLAQTLETGDFGLHRLKARRALEHGRIRRPIRITRDNLSVSHSTKWYD